MNRLASVLTAAVTTGLSAAAIGATAASQGVLGDRTTPTDATTGAITAAAQPWPGDARVIEVNGTPVAIIQDDSAAPPGPGSAADASTSAPASRGQAQLASPASGASAPSATSGDDRRDDDRDRRDDDDDDRRDDDRDRRDDDDDRRDDDDDRHDDDDD